MNKLYITIGFVAMLLLQLGLPSKMIFDQKQALEVGTPYKFKTQPIDPTDPFRGKYVALNYELDTFKTTDTTYIRGQEIYVYIAADSSGYAQASQVSHSKLKTDQDFVMAEVNWSNGTEVYFELPFNRLYMEEGKAFEAETAYSNANPRTWQQRDIPDSECYALVYINGGTVRLEDVFIDEMSLREVVLQNREKEKAATQ
ncbi:MAG: GDYXXLXY domain-containing protein [Gilvibacter sp.]